MPAMSYTATPPRSVVFGGSTFAQRRENIFKRLQRSAEQCSEKYSGIRSKELANDNDDVVVELCEALDETFNYGLRQNGNFVVTAANLFQNMHEIVTGNVAPTSTVNDNTFWDFCQNHLTPHERDRFENLKNVWTKIGRGRAFIRAALNENSLQRYLLTWLNDRELLMRYYTPWSLLLDEEAGNFLPDIIGSLDKVLFALTVDVIEHNRTIRATQSLVTKEEPIIYAPTPVPVANSKTKRKTNAIERPIANTASSEDILKNLNIEPITTLSTVVRDSEEFNGIVEERAEIMPIVNSSYDPIEPELEFLKESLPDVYPENQTMIHVDNSNIISSCNSNEFEDKSDSSSQYSKSSSTNHDSASCAVLEEKLREMNERYALLETRVAQLSLENRQLVRRLTRFFNDSGIDPTSSFATNFLITIPNVKLLSPNRAGSSYYAYEVHITMRQRLEHWSVLRRYRDFYKLHKNLLRTHPFVSSVQFPPKKHFGNKNLVFVEERRQQLQIYLLNLVESLPQVEICKTKSDLQRVFPFLREH